MHATRTRPATRRRPAVARARPGVSVLLPLLLAACGRRLRGCAFALAAVLLAGASAAGCRGSTDPDDADDIAGGFVGASGIHGLDIVVGCMPTSGLSQGARCSVDSSPYDLWGHYRNAATGAVIDINRTGAVPRANRGRLDVVLFSRPPGTEYRFRGTLQDPSTLRGTLEISSTVAGAPPPESVAMTLRRP
jgi:hypothetical protein